MVAGASSTRCPAIGARPRRPRASSPWRQRIVALAPMSLFPRSAVLRIGLYMLLGALSAIGLLIAFAGAVSYLVIAIYPLLAIWLAVGLFVAVSGGRNRLARAYVYGN